MGSRLPATTYQGGNYDNMDEKRRFSEESWEKGDIKIMTQQTGPNALFPPFDPNIPSSRGSETMRAHSLESGLHGVKMEHGHGNGHEHNPLHALVSGIRPPMAFGQRLKHFTFAWFTLTMATGGLATLISLQPHAFPGLISIGAVIYVTNIVVFLILCSLMLMRWAKHPGTFKASMQHEREGLFLGPFFLSVATIITGTQRYVVNALDATNTMRPWIQTSMAIAFWGYTMAVFLLAVLQYSYLFNTHMYHLNKFMPSWLLPIFPIMLSGTIAAVIAGDQPVNVRLPILVAGIGCQGLGFTVCLLMYAHYIGRLMCHGLPNVEHRPAMYIGVGPPSFTALAVLGMANALPPELNLLPPEIAVAPLFNVATIRIMSVIVAVSLWLLAWWFFGIATVAVLLKRPKLFHLGFWAIVFPNSGFTIATIQIGNALNNEGLRWLGNGMTIVIVIAWIFVLYLNIRAVVVRDIMWPGMDEDVDD